VLITIPLARPPAVRASFGIGGGPSRQLHAPCAPPRPSGRRHPGSSRLLGPLFRETAKHRTPGNCTGEPMKPSKGARQNVLQIAVQDIVQLTDNYFTPGGPARAGGGSVTVIRIWPL
jgi:hypothetical protein